MKKLLLFCSLVLCVLTVKAQILNDAASWPNSNWSVSGSYPAASLLSDPTVDATCSYDDDAVNQPNDEVFCTSPVIDLTAAFNGGETWINISVDYSYNFLNDAFQIEYFDADASQWILYEDLADNATSSTYLACTNGSNNVPNLDISGFSATQLSGFQYRFAYDDGGGWRYGFCVSSPTINSVAPPACPDPTNVTTATVTETSVDVSWTTGGSAVGFTAEACPSGTPAGDPSCITMTVGSIGGPVTVNGLSSSTDYDVYLTEDCGGAGTSATVSGGSITTLTPPPANDVCGMAVSLNVEGDLTCSNPVSGSTAGATETVVACAGSFAQGVWYSFVATGPDHTIIINNTGGSIDIVTQVFDACAGTEIECQDSPNSPVTLNGLTANSTYFFRIFDYQFSGTPQVTEFEVCVGTPPPPPSNDICSMAEPLVVNAPGATCTPYTADHTWATDDGAFTCDGGTGNIATWYSFTAPASGSIVVDITNGTQSGTAEGELFTACGTPVAGACDGSLDGEKFTGLTPNATYILAIWYDDFNTEGAFDICLEAVCGITSITSVSNSACSNNEYDATVEITYSAPPATGMLEVTVGNITQQFAVTSSPQQVTVTGCLADGALTDVLAEFTDDTDCFAIADDLFTAPVPCACLISAITDAGTGILNCQGTTFDYEVEVTYSNAPVGESLIVTAGSGSGVISAPQSGAGPFTETVTIGSLTIGSGSLDVTAEFSVSTGCTLTETGLIDAPAACPPDNDECAGAVMLDVNADFDCNLSTAGATTAATASSESTTGISGTANNDVWYSFTATNTQHRISLLNRVNVGGTSTSIDMGMALYDGTGGCGSLVFEGTSDPESWDVSGLSAGTTYYVRVYGWFGSIQDVEFDICVGTPPLPPACNEKFYDSGGAAGPYGDNELTVTTICPDIAGDVVTVTFVSFNTESGWDFLDVFDGDDTSAPSLGSFDGTTTPGPFTSTDATGCLTFEFDSDGSTTRDGWEADVTCGCPAPANVVLAPSTTTLMPADGCMAGNGWTYYEGAAGDYLFAIDWDPTDVGGGHNATASAAASITITTTDAGAEVNATNGTWTMARHWNIDDGGATLDGPVAIRFFYDPQEKTDAEAAASGSGLTPLETSVWFKTVGQDFDPNAITPVAVGQGAIELNVVSDGNTENGVTYVELDGIASFSGGTFAIGAGTQNANALPVELSAFDGVAVREGNLLRWSSASEINVESHQLERSIDGRLWEILGGIEANNRPSDYEMLDEEPQLLAYYRLRSVDFDGSYGLSKTVSIVRGDAKSDLVVRPMPFGSEFALSVSSRTDVKASITLRSIDGAIALQQYSSLSAGDNNIDVRTDDLLPGVYFLQVQWEGNVSTERVVKF